jgi:predicted amidohydrolase
MSDPSYAESIADLFCEFYDGAARIEQLMTDIAEVRAHGAVRHRKTVVFAAICDGDYDCERARHESEADSSGRVALGHLLGIDAALREANPLDALMPPAALSALASHYELHGRLSSDRTAGALLPRACPTSRPEQEAARFSDLFASVTRVSETAWEAANHCLFPSDMRMTIDDVADGLQIGCVPLLEDPLELTWTVRERHDIRYYHVDLNDVAVDDRIEDVLDALEAAEVQLAVFPELTCTEWLLERWREAVLRRSAAGWRLRWMLLGTGDIRNDGDRPVNAAVLLDVSSGEELMIQRKMFGFTLRPDQVRAWRLALPYDRALDEDIKKPRRPLIGETGFGRMAIFICQDLSESTELDDMVVQHAISHIVTPVFSEPTSPHFWEHQAAKTWAVQAGTTTIVANSLVVGRLQGRAGPLHAALVHCPWGTAATEADGPTDVQHVEVVSGKHVAVR